MDSMPSIQNQITTIPLSGLINWSVRYLKENRLRYKKEFKLYRIGDFLDRNRKQVEIKDDVNYRRVTVKLYNKGVIERDVVKGNTIGTKRQFVVSEGQFIMSKIDARNAAFGLVPKELDGAIVTADFLTYNIDKSKIDPQFLRLLTSTKQFVSFCQNASSGTTGRQRVQESTFLNFQIPLPLISEQKRIIESYNHKITMAHEQNKSADRLEKVVKENLRKELGIELIFNKREKGLHFVSFKNLHRWDDKGKIVFKSKYQIKKLSDISLEISTGTTPPTSRREYFNGDVKFYTPTDLGREMYLSESSRTLTRLALVNKKARCFERNTLLFVGIGSTIGKVGLIGNEFATSNQQITGIKINTNIVKPEFIFHYFNEFKDITTLEQTQATIPIVNQDKINNIPIPIPPMKIQEELSNKISSMKKEIKNLYNQAEENQLLAIKEFEQEIFYAA